MKETWLPMLERVLKFERRAQTVRFSIGLLLLFSVMPFAAADDESELFFEREIRPVLVERCVECHDESKHSGGLQVGTRDSLISGGDSGPALIPGDSAGSLMVQAIRHQDGLEMPPKGELTPQQISAITHWIDIGAPWPAATKLTGETRGNGTHWAFKPLHVVHESVTDDAWCQTFIDPYIKSKLDEHSLPPAPPADRRTLIRRISYTLTGLPPTAKEIQQFLADPRPNALEMLVDRLLASSAYGEHWARHWLDIARYSDTKGYVYAREERQWVHAWSYRDWVTQAFNENMAYDRFLLLQLAADQVEDRRKSDLAAMGFLTLGRRFLGVDRDIIDDRIDVVCRGMLGLTVSCARCHDHKYDPIPTADYYSLYGVFDSCQEELVCVDDAAMDDAFRAELETRQQVLHQKLTDSCQESSARCRERVADYLNAQTELHKYPANGFDQIFAKTDLLPDYVRQWETYLYEADRKNDPAFVHWHAYANIPAEDFASHSAAVTEELSKLPTQASNAIIANAFRKPPTSFHDVVQRYGKAFEDVNAEWNALVADPSSASQPPTQLSDPAAEELREILYGEDGPCSIPTGGIVDAETYFDSATCTELWKLQGEVDRHIISSSVEAPFALILQDRRTPKEPRIFRRGNPLTQGESVPRKFLSVLSGTQEPKNFRVGSGRHELALEIISPDNPLTARVMVNRVWAQHFGRGLVDTPSDFGRRAEEPTHLLLLDALTSRFVAAGWDLKKLHRWILLSATFGQASAIPSDDDENRARQIDPDNQLLWRMSPRRLTFEEFRDSMFVATDELTYRIGGKPSQLFEQPTFARRTVYANVDRQYLPATLRVFDFANPDLHVSERSETTVPQQALFLMNHPLVLDRARELARLAKQQPHRELSVQSMFRRTLQRTAAPNELADALVFLDSQNVAATPIVSLTEADWKYGFGKLDEANERVTGFAALPHFTGTAWQGGPKFPDGDLGWVQLTAKGGHPGNDRDHAAIRRWTAPREMTLQIRSELIHQRSPGDGVRAFIVSSAAGVLAKAAVHQSTARLDVDNLHVQKGETIDFVVDIGDVLNSDEHLWQQTLTPTAEQQLAQPEVAAAPVQGTRWDSETDFTKQQSPKLDPWEQLAQILLCTNEFMFID